MCKNPCEELLLYIKKSLKYKHGMLYGDLNLVGLWLRRSKTDDFICEVHILCKHLLFSLEDHVRVFRKKPYFIIRDGMIEEIKYIIGDPDDIFFYKSETYQYIIYVGGKMHVWPEGKSTKLEGKYGGKWRLV